MSIERAFKFKGLYFDLICIMAESMVEMLHDVMVTAGFNTTDVLVVPPCDYQLRHLAVIPPHLCLVRQRPDELLTVKAISDRAVTFLWLVGIKLTRNNSVKGA